MTDLILNILLGVFAALCLGAGVFAVTPTLLNSSPSGDIAKVTERVREFILLKPGEKGGGLFVELIEDGFLLSLVMGNHSKGFDDSTQLEDFKNYLTTEIASAMKKVGETYDRYYL